MTSPYYDWIDVGERFAPSEPGYVHKFQRAVTHLNAIAYEMGDFIARGIHTPVSPEAEVHRNGWIIIRRGATNSPPGAWALYLGDFLTNARATLDYLIYDLVRANNNDPGNHTAFPICETAGKWRDDITQRAAERGPAPTRGLPEDALAIISEEQPLRHGSDKSRKNDPLMHLLRMSNTDKHRRLHIAAIETGKVLKVWAKPEGVVEIYRFQAAPIDGPVKNDTEVARVKARRIPGSDPDTDVYFQFRREAQILFREPGETRKKATLHDLFGIINSIMKIGCRLESHVQARSTWFTDLYHGRIGGGHRSPPGDR